jgi:hypothetical protein
MTFLSDRKKSPPKPQSKASRFTLRYLFSVIAESSLSSSFFLHFRVGRAESRRLFVSIAFLTPTAPITGKLLRKRWKTAKM